MTTTTTTTHTHIPRWFSSLALWSFCGCARLLLCVWFCVNYVIYVTRKALLHITWRFPLMMARPWPLISSATRIYILISNVYIYLESLLLTHTRDEAPVWQIQNALMFSSATSLISTRDFAWHANAPSSSSSSLEKTARTQDKSLLRKSGGLFNFAK